MKNLAQATTEAVNYFYENNNDDFLQGREDQEFVSKKEIEDTMTYKYNEEETEIEFSFKLWEVEGMMSCGGDEAFYTVEL